MFCTQCGNEVEQHARFCSKCGHEAGALTATMTTAPVAPKKAHDMDMHVNMPIPIPPGMPHFIGWITTVIGLGAAALAAGIAAAGVGLLQYRSWARVMAVVMAVFLLFHFPIGTVIGVYAFWVLFSKEGQEYYNARSASTMTASGT